jgi:hypothetical protein
MYKEAHLQSVPWGWHERSDQSGFTQTWSHTKDHQLGYCIGESSHIIFLNTSCFWPRRRPSYQNHPQPAAWCTSLPCTTRSTQSFWTRIHTRRAICAITYIFLCIAPENRSKGCYGAHQILCGLGLRVPSKPSPWLTSEALAAAEMVELMEKRRSKGWSFGKSPSKPKRSKKERRVSKESFYILLYETADQIANPMYKEEWT